MPRVRHKYLRNYTTLDNQVIRDTRLSYKARGIFLYLWHLPEDWEISLRDLQLHSDEDGAVSVRTGVAELEEHGYLAYEWRREMGKFSDAEWTLNEKPGLDFTIPAFTNSVNPTTPKDSEERSTINLKTEEENTPKPPRGTRTRTKKHDRLRMDYTSGFQLWWDTYPPDRRFDKPQCFAVWLTHNLEARTEEQVAKIERLKETDWKNTERKYVKSSLPYLNSGRFEDDLRPLPPQQLTAIEQLEQEGYFSERARDVTPRRYAPETCHGLQGALGERSPEETLLSSSRVNSH